jgi:cell shape-determining protein MreC
MLNYRQQRNKKYWGPIGLTFLAVILLFVLTNPIRDIFTGPLIFFTKPFWQVSDNLGTLTSNQISGFGKSRQNLLVENKALLIENKKLKTLLKAKNDLEIDNLKLREVLGRTEAKINPVLARVIFLPNFVPYNNLLLDIGENNRTRPIKVGDFVVADGTILIGRLTEIDATYSKVKLISAETNLSVVIGPQNIPAVAVGSGAGNLTITLPKDTPVFIGDQVRVSLLNNYLVGSVGHIEKLTSRPTQTILVRTPVNLWQLKWLEIYNAKA